MPNFTDAVAGAVRSTTCGILAANANLQGWWAQNTELPFTGALAAGAEGLRRGLCDNPAPVPEQPNSVGNRGQCPDTIYRFSRTYRTFRDGVEIDEDTRVNDVRGQIVPATFPNFGNGVAIGYRVGVGSPFPGVDQYVYFPSDGQTATQTINEITPVFGPNNCPDNSGPDPAPIYDIPPTNINVTYIDNSNTEITEQGDFNLALPIFLPGSIVIPFNIDFGGFELNGTINQNGDINIELNPGRQPDDTETDTEAPELPPGQEPVDPETERRIIGVHVFTTLPPNTPVTTIFQEDGPNIFAPRGGSVRFLVTGGGGSSWTRDIDIKGDRQYIPCPAQQGAISVIGNELPGGTVSLIRVYGSIPSYLIPGA